MDEWDFEVVEIFNIAQTFSAIPVLCYHHFLCRGFVIIQLNGLATPISRDAFHPSMGLVVAIPGDKHPRYGGCETTYPNAEVNEVFNCLRKGLKTESGIN